MATRNRPKTNCLWLRLGVFPLDGRERERERGKVRVTRSVSMETDYAVSVLWNKIFYAMTLAFIPYIFPHGKTMLMWWESTNFPYFSMIVHGMSTIKKMDQHTEFVALEAGWKNPFIALVHNQLATKVDGNAIFLYSCQTLQILLLSLTAISVLWLNVIACRLILCVCVPSTIRIRLDINAQTIASYWKQHGRNIKNWIFIESVQDLVRMPFFLSVCPPLLTAHFYQDHCHSHVITDTCLWYHTNSMLHISIHNVHTMQALQLL